MMLIYSKKRADTFLFIYIEPYGSAGRDPGLSVCLTDYARHIRPLLFRIRCGSSSSHFPESESGCRCLSNGYTYPHNTAYYHYNKPPSQSQDFNTVFVIIDKSAIQNLCKTTKMPASDFQSRRSEIRCGQPPQSDSFSIILRAGGIPPEYSIR